MRKDLDDMTPEELREEKRFQENHFRHLVSDMPILKDAPKTWYGRWWREWEACVTTTAKIIFGTILIYGVVCGGMWLAIVCLTAL